MFECTLEQGELFKKIVAALSDLVSEGNFMIDTNRISFQGMDSSHVSLVALSLNATGFEPYRCDRDITLGINFSSLNKILKCMASKDQLNIRANDDADSVFFTFASANDKRVSNFELKLMDIDAEQLGIPDTEYSTTVKMPSSEFQRICRDLAAIGDSVVISASKEGVKFSVSGDIGSGDMILQGRMTRRKKKKSQNNNNVNNNNNGDDNNDNDEKQANDDSNNNDVKVKDEETPGNEDNKNAVTQDIDGDEPMNDNEDNEDVDIQNKPKDDKNVTKGNDNDKNKDNDNNNDNDNDDNDQEMEEEEEEEYEQNADEDEKKQIVIELNEPVTQTFALRYLNNFTKATGLSSMVTLSMGGEVPLMVEYKMDQLGYIRYYLAPKIDEDQ